MLMGHRVPPTTVDRISFFAFRRPGRVLEVFSIKRALLVEHMGKSVARTFHREMSLASFHYDARGKC